MMTCSKGDAQLYKLMITYDDEVHGLGFLGLPSKPLQLTKCFCRNHAQRCYYYWTAGDRRSSRCLVGGSTSTHFNFHCDQGRKKSKEQHRGRIWIGNVEYLY